MGRMLHILSSAVHRVGGSFIVYIWIWKYFYFYLWKRVNWKYIKPDDIKNMPNISSRDYFPLKAFCSQGQQINLRNMLIVPSTPRKGIGDFIIESQIFRKYLGLLLLFSFDSTPDSPWTLWRLDAWLPVYKDRHRGAPSSPCQTSFPIDCMSFYHSFSACLIIIKRRNWEFYLS